MHRPHPTSHPFTLGREPSVPVLYLDIDGTVRRGADDPGGRWVNGPEDVTVFAEAVTMMRRWKLAGNPADPRRTPGRVVGVSNQGGVALGIVSFERVAAAMLETAKQADLLFDKIAFCVHHPDASDPEMARCWCRKPSPGLVIESALELARQHHEKYPPHLGLFVGDRAEDAACAENAGLDFLDAATWRALAEQPAGS